MDAADGAALGAQLTAAFAAVWLGACLINHMARPNGPGCRLAPHPPTTDPAADRGFMFQHVGDDGEEVHYHAWFSAQVYGVQKLKTHVEAPELACFAQVNALDRPALYDLLLLPPQKSALGWPAARPATCLPRHNEPC